MVGDSVMAELDRCEQRMVAAGSVGARRSATSPPARSMSTPGQPAARIAAETMARFEAKRKQARP